MSAKNQRDEYKRTTDEVSKTIRRRQNWWLSLHQDKSRGNLLTAYWGGYGEGMVSFTLPAGILLPGKSYIWRVRVGDSHADSHDWIKLQNVAVSERMSFTMAQLLE